MYLLPENSKRRESVIAGLTAALVGIAMIALAGKASAMHPVADPAHQTSVESTAPAPAESAAGDTDGHTATADGGDASSVVLFGSAGLRVEDMGRGPAMPRND